MPRHPNHAEFDLTGVADVDAPPNVIVGPHSRIVADDIARRAVFGRFRSKRDPAIIVEENTLIENVAFNLDAEALVRIGSSCDLQDCFLISAEEITIGNAVVIGWHATIVDSDFHPIDPAERKQDVLALSPLAATSERHRGVARRVIIEDDVWIGPLAVILKGVRIARGARIEPGAVITHDVPAGARMRGNPGQPFEGK